MRVARLAALAVVVVGALGASRASACDVAGRVVCEGTGAPVEGAKVTFTSSYGTEFSTTTGSDGSYFLSVYSSETFDVTVDASALGGSVVHATVTSGDGSALQVLPDFAVDVPGCEGAVLKCWLTGGGAKFSSITGGTVAEHGPQISIGGNVNPSCSAEPGQGGQWNHVDHAQKLHFQGLAIRVDQCGNIDGIPPGSTSPVTPVNFIDFSGTGVLKGIQGNKFPTKEVCFVARAEDRNEPGSNGARDGAYKDRYFIRVFDCVTNALELVFEATPGADDTQWITDGNLQMHATSCTE